MLKVDKACNAAVVCKTLCVYCAYLGLQSLATFLKLFNRHSTSISCLKSGYLFIKLSKAKVLLL